MQWLRPVVRLIAVALTPLAVQAQTLTFDQPTPCTGNGSYLAGPSTCATYSEQGYTFTRESGADGASFVGVVLGRADGAAFSLASLALREADENPLFPSGFDPADPYRATADQAIELIGTRADGGVVRHYVFTDQLAGFQTLASGEFTDLVSLQIRPDTPVVVIWGRISDGNWDVTFGGRRGTPAIVLDNVVLQPSVAAIPEPATVALFVPSLAIVGWMMRRRRR